MTQRLSTLPDLHAVLASWRKAGQHVALVPTMGALHAGHVALVKHAKTRADKVVVSIFVNPTQFGPNEDFSRYPRMLEADLAMLADAGADAAWVPDVATMYPDGFATSIRVSGVSEGLDGAVRPGHFDGVATVVAKLLNQVGPDVALFGEKDYQQLCVIRRLVMDLNLPVDIIGVPTVREADGLALSSRNQYLSPEERKVAPTLYATLCALASELVIPAQAGISSLTSNAVESGCRGNDEMEALCMCARQRLLNAGFASVDYLELCDASTLVPLAAYTSPARLLVAARLGTTRLIDNIEV